MDDERETIEETTVGTLGNLSVGMGNMTTGEYALPDGSLRVGTICFLAPEDRDGGILVGLGSQVEIGGFSWEVVAIEKPRGELGSVTLARLRLK